MLRKLNTDICQEGIEAHLFWWLRELAERQVWRKVVIETINLIDFRPIDLDFLSDSIKRAIS